MLNHHYSLLSFKCKAKMLDLMVISQDFCVDNWIKSSYVQMFWLQTMVMFKQSCFHIFSTYLTSLRRRMNSWCLWSRKTRELRKEKIITP